MTKPPAPDPITCVEEGVWTPLPVPPPAALHEFTLHIGTVDPAEHERIQAAGAMSFHVVGCTGDFSNHMPGTAVAEAMASQLISPDGSAPSFLFHLGDIVYKDPKAKDPEGDDQKRMYNDQFYGPYAGYGRAIFAVPGNHDCKRTSDPKSSAIDHFLRNFCAPQAGPSPDNATDRRPAMTQPYPYWRLTTPPAYIIGLDSNVANGGILDDPSHPHHTPQYDWLVAQLQDVRQKNAHRTPRKAIVLAVHYPPYSGATNFAQRGDPTLGPTNANRARPLGAVLQDAYAASGQRPDAVISAHAHLYQRLTYRYADGWEVPYLIAGSGGHAPVENLWVECGGQPRSPLPVPFDAVLPRGLTLPAGDTVQVVAYDDQSFGFARLTIGAGTLRGEFFTVNGGTPVLADAFCLDLDTHRIVEQA